MLRRSYAIPPRPGLLSRPFLLAASWLATSLPAFASPPAFGPPPPPASLASVVLPRETRLANPHVAESSSLLPSPRHPGVFWTLNDSNHPARLYALRADGSTVGPAEGWPVPGAVNTDWEALTALPDGSLVIGDIGNNTNQRRDLALYLWPEPDPFSLPDSAAPHASRLPFRYADQTFPTTSRNHDAEALYFADGHVHLLTKHRSDAWTTLYRFEHLDPSLPAQILKPLLRFRAGSMVTAAAVSENQRQLAVLTYAGLWLFTRPGPDPCFFSGEVAWAPHFAGQCEAVAWTSPDSLLLTNEEGWLHPLPLTAFHPLGPVQTVAPPNPAHLVSGPEPFPLAGPPSLLLNEYNAVRSSRWLHADHPDEASPEARDLRLGRVPGNGGPWLELVILASPASPSLDLRGARLDWRHGGASGSLMFTREGPGASFLAALPRGAILTLAHERQLLAEDGRLIVRGSRPHFDPAEPDYHWLHLWTQDPTFFDPPAPLGRGETINDDFQVRIRDASYRLLMDWTGEGIAPLGGVNSREIFQLRTHPSPEITADSPHYSDGIHSTFGAPNRWRDADGTWHQQDFRPLLR